MYKVIIKNTKAINSTKSQFHQPPQFNSCWAHQPPKKRAKKLHNAIINIFFLNIKITKFTL